MIFTTNKKNPPLNLHTHLRPARTQTTRSDGNQSNTSHDVTLDRPDRRYRRLMSTVVDDTTGTEEVTCDVAREKEGDNQDKPPLCQRLKHHGSPPFAPVTRQPTMPDSTAPSVHSSCLLPQYACMSRTEITIVAPTFKQLTAVNLVLDFDSV